MAALAVVQRDVDALVDQGLQGFSRCATKSGPQPRSRAEVNLPASSSFEFVRNGTVNVQIPRQRHEFSRPAQSTDAIAASRGRSPAEIRRTSALDRQR